MKTFSEYQCRAHETAQPYEDATHQVVLNMLTALPIQKDGDHHTDDTARAIVVMTKLLALNYVTMGLAGEAGEFANKSKKILRDAGGVVSEDAHKELVKELGGVLWYLAECCTVLGIDFGRLAEVNLAQLAARKNAGTLQGSGDNR